MSTRHLDKLLNPTSIAVVGASAREQSPGLALARNLLAGKYTGTLYLVNPRYASILGETCFRSLKQLPIAPDLVIILSPERIVKRTLTQSARLGVKVVIIMSALQNSKAIHNFAQTLGIRLLGPYCAGVIRPHLNLNASYSNNRIMAGPLAIVSHSASLGAAVLDWAQDSSVGFSALLSTGIDTDISLADLLDLLAEDQHTRAIIVYLDRITGTRAFLSAIIAAARIKPVVLMKSTRDAARYCDALTRTGQTHSSDSVVQAALNRAGVVRIRTFANLLAAARILASGVRTQGRRLAIVSNGAAPAMMACERIESKDFLLPTLSSALKRKLHAQISGQWSHTNPLVLRDAESLANQYQAAINTLTASAEFDAVLVIFVPDSRNNPTTIAAAVISCNTGNTPMLTCWMGGASVITSREQFSNAHIPTFRTPEAATDGFDFLHRYFISQQLLVQMPNPASRKTRADVLSARQLVEESLLHGERVLGPQKTRVLLKHFDIDVLDACRVTSEADAVKAALKIGYPVALKLVSPNIALKASVIGAQLDIQNENSLRRCFQQIEQRTRDNRPEAEFRGVLIEAMHSPDNNRSLAISINRDPTFGPVLSVGMGGDLTALVEHRAVQLPPLNQFLIDDLLSRRELLTYLGEFRHHPSVGSASVSHVLRQLSELICEIPEVFTLHINPLRVSQTRAVAMEVQIVLERNKESRRYAHLAIHPYPWQWIRNVSLKQQRSVQLRPIRPEDGESLRKLVRKMSAESRYFRFMHAVNDLSPQMVAQFTKLDYDRQMAFVAEAGDGSVVGVSRYTMSADQQSGEFAISIVDDWQGQGLATALLQVLNEHAAAQGLNSLRGDVLRTNRAMRGLMQSMGFSRQTHPTDKDVLTYTYSLRKDA